MPEINPYNFGQTVSEAGGNPYGGYLSRLLQSRQAKENKINTDAVAQLRQLIEQMARRPQNSPTSVPVPPPPTPEATAYGQPEMRGVYNPEGYLGTLGGVESSNKWDAVNTGTGAGGRYQFLEPTWTSIIKEAPHLGLTPEGRTGTSEEHQGQQTRGVRYLTNQNAGIFNKEFGRDPTHAELYAMHFLGPGYGAAIMRNPDTPIPALVPPLFIAKNPLLKNMTGRSFMQHFGRKFNR